MLKTQLYLKIIIGVLLAILFSIAVILAAVVYYIAPTNISGTLQPNQPLPEVKKTPIINTTTGKPLSQAEVGAITQKQKIETRVGVLDVKITGKSPNSLEAAITIDGQTHTLNIAIVPATTLFAAVPGAGSSAIQQKKISFADIKIGETATLLSKAGILINQITAEKIEVNSIVVHRYPEPDISND